MLHEATLRTIAYQGVTGPMDRAQELQKLKQELARKGKDLKVMEVQLYACPTAGCTNYFGHSMMPDLTPVSQHRTDLNFTPHPEETHHSRAQCPVCRAAGKQVERQLVTTIVAMPVDRAPLGPVA